MKTIFIIFNSATAPMDNFNKNIQTFLDNTRNNKSTDPIISIKIKIKKDGCYAVIIYYKD